MYKHKIGGKYGGSIQKIFVGKAFITGAAGQNDRDHLTVILACDAGGGIYCGYGTCMVNIRPTA